MEEKKVIKNCETCYHKQEDLHHRCPTITEESWGNKECFGWIASKQQWLNINRICRRYSEKYGYDPNKGKKVK